MRYYKAFWGEARGDEYDSWGGCTFWYEVGDDGWPTRHMEVYEDGTVLQYGFGAVDEDEYGFLACGLIDPEEFPPGSETTEEAFKDAWTAAKPINPLIY